MLLSKEQYEAVYKLRRGMRNDSLEYTDQFIKTLRRYKKNEEFVQKMLKQK